MTERIILHSDLNSFYASVECMKNPSLKNTAVAVGGSIENRHGIILAKNTIAQKFGIITGEAIWQAKKKCPNLTILPPNYALYLSISKEVRKIYSRYTDLIEPFGIDEAWLDVTNSSEIFGSGEKIANEIRHIIKKEIGITASIGVSYNKIFAKIGSDLKKPDYTSVITSSNFKQLIWPLPAGDLLYVGPSTKKKLYNLGIYKIGDLAKLNIDFLKSIFGKWGEYLWIFANGLDSSNVKKSEIENIIKGVGNSLTTPRDLTTNEDVKILLFVLSESVSERLRRYGFKGKTIQIYIRDKQLNSITRQCTLHDYTNITLKIVDSGYQLFLKNWNWLSPIRSIGIRVTDLTSDVGINQISFFEDDKKFQNKEILEKSIDKIRKKYGHYSIQRAILLKDKSLNANPIEENVIFPVSFFN